MNLSAKLFAGLVSLVLASAAASAAAKLRAQPPVEAKTIISGIDVEVRRAMTQEHVAGAALGVMVNGKVILAKGYGVREVGKPAPIDANTIFDIGSITKSFTATAVAALVDDGKLDWDTPVVNYLPWFQMYDPMATQLITLRDMLAHRSGLARHDFIRVSTYLSREELVRRFRYLEPVDSMRNAFHYNNLMYAAAGYIAGQVVATTWENLVKQRVLIPLGMTRSNTSAVELQQSDNYAHPHAEEHGKIVPIPVYDYQKFGVGPNGAINSSVNDMLKYLAFHMANGKSGDRQVISVKQMMELHRPLIAMPRSATGFDRYYALGWEVSYRNGHEVLEHNGAVAGFTSDMVFIPDQQAAIIVLNNAVSDLPTEIAHELTDRVVGNEPVDYIAKDLQADAARNMAAAAQKAKLDAARIPNSHPTLDLASYEGTYFHAAYGQIKVERAGNDLLMRFDALNLSLKHYNYDTFVYDSFGGSSFAQFHVDATGNVSDMLLPLEPTVKPFVFVKTGK